MITTDLEGIQFLANAAGARSTTQASKAIYAAALEQVAPQAARAVRDERKWRTGYPEHLRALTVAGIVNPEHALTIAAEGLAEAWRQFELIRASKARPFAEAMQNPVSDPFTTVTVQGQGAPTIEPWALPYRGRRLQGEELRDQIARWEQNQIIEPSHAQAIYRVMDHPEWFDLSDRTMVLLGAASEAGPLAALAKWRANIVAIDLPRPTIWQKITQTITEGNGRLFAPLNKAVGSGPAGANLLTQTPEIAAWLKTLDRSLDIAALAYLDGEQHMRVSMAMDGIIATVSASHPGTTLMYMATPAEIFAVPEATARAVMCRLEERSGLRHIADGVVRALSGGRLLRPHITDLLSSTNGKRYGIVDGIVIEQGPNYALAKRLQQWRAVKARAAGQRVAINVTPSTMTQSVVKNPALKAGYAGAGRFGIEVFEPATTSALMAAMWVHDLRCGNCSADPAYPLAHPLELLMEGANHGGLWRIGYLPRSALPLAALMGYLRMG